MCLGEAGIHNFMPSLSILNKPLLCYDNARSHNILINSMNLLAQKTDPSNLSIKTTNPEVYHAHWPVKDSSLVLQRCYLLAREMGIIVAAWLPTISRHEAKMLTPKHLWQDFLHAEKHQERVFELRFPRQNIDENHDPVLVELMEQLRRSASESELILALYEVFRPALAEAYQTYLDRADPLTDEPTFAYVQTFVRQLREQIAEAAEIVAWAREQLSVAERDAWLGHLRAGLAAAGGVLGIEASSEWKMSPAYATRPAMVLPSTALRDPRHQVRCLFHYPRTMLDDDRARQLAAALSHVNEAWASEAVARTMAEFPKAPLELLVKGARWCYDEMRHAQIGERRLKAWGFDLFKDVPIDALSFNLYSEAGHLYRFGLLHEVETRYNLAKVEMIDTFEKMGDWETRNDIDFDNADEAIHMRYAVDWFAHIFGRANRQERNVYVKGAGKMYDDYLALHETALLADQQTWLPKLHAKMGIE